MCAVKTKDAIRQEVWALLRQKKVARFPGAEGRIPNFIGAEKCAKILAQSPAWKNAKVIKANPDSPQRAVRQRALEEGKVIYMAVPRLREPKPFIELDPSKLQSSPYNASSIKGAFKYGRPVTLDEVKRIDLVVCGSVAVNRRGARLGKGGGYSDLEFALLREERKISGQTPIVTTVHPLQIFDTDLPMTEHDIPLNAIVTPDEIIPLKPHYRRPKGIYWHLLPAEKIDAIPVLMARKETKKRRTQKQK
ncbi:MAG: 5-formyltetrahydrofolate cyclo-ligase [Deltaproteobacteria bacterium]|nr:MAG: 5-formyltetrahydrofolate cyclo-ligase [Deltaproteobacteria bacterium]